MVGMIMIGNDEYCLSKMFKTYLKLVGMNWL